MGRPRFNFPFMDGENPGVNLPCFNPFFINSVLTFFFQKNHRPKYVSCIAFSVNCDVLTGDTDGSICVWPEGLC